MRKTNYAGIDYAGFSQVNRDKKTGIRYGIIPANDIGQAWYDSGEPQYGEPHCPKCGDELPTSDDHQTCKCGHEIKWCGDECYPDPDQPIGITYEAEGYACNEDQSGDIWIFKSPYFTYAQFCSPCAPGACYLRNPLEWADGEEPSENNRAYCFGHDRFEDGVAPYPVYSVETGNLVVATKVNVPCPNCGATGRDTLARIAQVRDCSVTQLLCQIDLGNEPGLVSGLNRNDQTFDCFSCNGKGTVEEMNYSETP